MQKERKTIKFLYYLHIFKELQIICSIIQLCCLYDLPMTHVACVIVLSDYIWHEHCENKTNYYYYEPYLMGKQFVSKHEWKSLVCNNKWMHTKYSNKYLNQNQKIALVS